MARFFLSALVALAAGVASAEQLDGTDPIILTPSDAKTGAPKVLVINNGAFVSNEEYVGLATAIQDAAPMPLWIALPSYAGNVPDPITIGFKIKNALKAITAAGYEGEIDPSTDVVIGGHSLGGIFSQMAVSKSGYAGLMLFGSYLSSSSDNTVDNYPFPVLTLAGEIDGLTRITRVAQSWSEYATLLASGVDNVDALKYTRAVVALPGVTHSLFCDTVNVTAFGTKDKCPEVSRASAQAAMGATGAAFLSVVFGADKNTEAAARKTLDAGLKYTEALVAGYLTAQALEAQDWCGSAQLREGNGLDLSVDVTKCGNFATFNMYNPSLAGTNVTAVVETGYVTNPTDVSTVDLSATEIDCKMVSAAALAAAFGQPAPKADSTCEEVNVDAIALAGKLVSTDTTTRYARIGQPFVTQADVVYTTGITWQAGKVVFDTKGENVVVGSPRLTIGVDSLSYAGQQMCKYLSPAHVIEYMMVDGIPAFDECA